MKRWVLLLAALLVLTPTLPAEEENPFHDSATRRFRKDKERNVRKAASRKKKELREMGVKSVRVKAPGDWPRKVAVPKGTELQEIPAPQGFAGHLYASNNYVYFSPVELKPSAQKTVSRLCECAFAANKAIAEVLPVPRPMVERGDRKFVVTLMPSMEEYRAAGGPQSSAGVFMGSYRQGAYPLKEEDVAMDQVMIPFESLGLNRSGAVQKEDIDTHALVHELTHQQFLLNSLPIWANEGWAEYVGYVPYVGEDLDFDRGFSLILHTARERSGQGALDFDFTLEEFLTMDQQRMYACMPQGKDTYTLSVMTVAFFVHLDGKRGIDAMKAYLRAILDGKSHEEAAGILVAPYRTPIRLQQAFTRAWKSKKVKVTFSGR